MAIQVPSRGAWLEIGRAEVAGAPDDVLTIAGLDGDAQQLFVIDFSIVHAAPTTAYDFKFGPNGDFGNSFSNYVFDNGSLVTRANLGLIIAAAGRNMQGRAILQATQFPLGSAVARARGYTFQATSGSPSPTFGGILTGGGAWSAAGNLTAISLASTTVGTNTAQNGLGVGTVMRILAPRGPR